MSETKTAPLGWNDPPKLFVEQISAHRWKVWVEWGLLRVSGEWGTYAWSRKAAIRKGQRLLADVEKMKKRRAARECIR
jgi:hypothetical protein